MCALAVDREGGCLKTPSGVTFLRWAVGHRYDSGVGSVFDTAQPLTEGQAHINQPHSQLPVNQLVA